LLEINSFKFVALKKASVILMVSLISLLMLLPILHIANIGLHRLITHQNIAIQNEGECLIIAKKDYLALKNGRKNDLFINGAYYDFKSYRTIKGSYFAVLQKDAKESKLFSNLANVLNNHNNSLWLNVLLLFNGFIIFFAFKNNLIPFLISFKTRYNLLPLLFFHNKIARPPKIFN